MGPSCGSTALSGAASVVVPSAAVVAVAIGVATVGVTALVTVASGVLVTLLVTEGIGVSEAGSVAVGWASRVAVPATAVCGWAARAVAVASAAAMVAMAAVWVASTLPRVRVGPVVARGAPPGARGVGDSAPPGSVLVGNARVGVGSGPTWAAAVAPDQPTRMHPIKGAQSTNREVSGRIAAPWSPQIAPC